MTVITADSPNAAAALRGNGRQLCTCRVGELLLGIDVLIIQEVLHHSEVTEIPRTSPAIAGLINLRGQIATAIDLRVRLGVERTEGNDDVQIVVRHHGEPVSLLVDEIGDVMTVDIDIFEPPPETITGVARDIVTGAYKLEDELLLTFDVDRAISASNSQTEGSAR